MRNIETIKWDSPLQKEVVDFLLTIPVKDKPEEKLLHFNGYSGTIWLSGNPKSSEDVSQFYELYRTHSGKSLAGVRILVYSNVYKEADVNLKIELYLNSYCEWYTFFDGWIPDITELKTILQSVGLLPYGKHI